MRRAALRFLASAVVCGGLGACGTLGGAGDGLRYPDLAAIPAETSAPAPVAERRAIVESLIADRANARHTAETLQAVAIAPAPPPPPPPAAPEPPAAPAAEPPAAPAAEPPAEPRRSDAVPLQTLEVAAFDPPAAASSDVVVVEPASFGAAPRAFAPLPALASAQAAVAAGSLTATLGAVSVNWAVLGVTRAAATPRQWVIDTGRGPPRLSAEARRSVAAAASRALAGRATLRVVGLAAPRGGLDASGAALGDALEAAEARAAAVVRELAAFGLDPSALVVEAAASPLGGDDGVHIVLN